MRKMPQIPDFKARKKILKIPPYISYLKPIGMKKTYFCENGVSY